jgi:alkyldihydroxyacetonephosphate synthase
MHRVPDVVVWPTDEVDCVKLVDVAAKHSLCLVPFGGGTNVTRATWCPSFDVDPRPMVSVDMRRMNKIIWINKEDGLAHIEAGMVGRDMCTELAKHGLTVGHEPDSIEFSTLGGWVATRASGMKRNRYGNIEDIVREVRLVTSTGIMSQHHHNDPISEDGGSKSAFARTSIGTELKDLVLGSEGNLGIISSVVVRVHPLPGKTDYGSILFPSFDVGLDFMRDLARLPSALRPASVRLADHTQFVWGGHLSSDRTSLKRQVAKLYLTSWLHWDPESICGCSILYEGTDDEVGIQKKFVNQLVSKYKALSTGSAHGAAGYDLTFAIGYIRDFAISHYVLGESFETFVPWSCCRALCQRVKEDVKLAHKQRSLPGKPTISCRITQLYGEGACVYFYLAIYVKGVASPCSAFAEMEKEARNSCLRHGGSLSHHHGVGKVRAPYLSTVNSPGLTQWLRQMKQNVDASNIFGVSNGVCAREDTPKDIIGEVD